MCPIRQAIGNPGCLSLRIALYTLLLMACRLEASAQTGAAVSPADWPSYNHDVSGWRFNPAEKTLGPGNVGKLVEKWRFPAAGSTQTVGVVHATPSVVNGEVYFGTATDPAFYKLAPDGTLRWTYRNPSRKSVLPTTDGAPVTEKLRDAVSRAGIFSSDRGAIGCWQHRLPGRIAVN